MLCRALDRNWKFAIAMIVWANIPVSLAMFAPKRAVSCAAKSSPAGLLSNFCEFDIVQRRDFSLNAANQKSKSSRSNVESKENEEQSFSFYSVESSFKNAIGTTLDNSPTLVLNADYTPLSHAPLSIWHWQDTIRAVLSGKARIVSEYSGIEVRSVTCAFKLPSVISLNHFYKQPMKAPAMTRRYVYIRDNFHCQYCMKKFTIDKLSLDHVIPRAQGGRLVWTNTVTACHGCNAKKGSVAVEDLPLLGMRLRKPPHTPTRQEIQQKYRAMKKDNYHPHWREFL